MKGKTATNGKLFKWEKCTDNEQLTNGSQSVQRFDQPFKQMNKLFKWLGNPLELMNK